MKIQIITITFFLFIMATQAQTVKWMNTYNSGYPQSGYSDIGMEVFEDEDGKLLIIANTEYLLYDSSGHYIASESPFLVFQTDENGTILNRHLYCDPKRSVDIRNRNAFAFGGDTIIAIGRDLINDGVRVRHKLFVLGIDYYGDSLFCSIIDTNMNLFWPTTAPTHDGKLITGSRNVLPSGEVFVDSMIIFKHSIAGEVLWSRRYNMHNDPYYIYPCQDNGFLICDRSWIMKVDSLGDSLWAITLPYSALPTSIIEKSPNEFICLAISGYHYIAVFKVSGEGDIDWWRQWMFDYSDVSYLYAYSLIPTFDGNCVFCGQTGGNGTGSSPDAFLVKIDSLANVIWQKRIDLFGRPDIFHSVIQTRDSSFVCTGSASLCTDPDSVECESLEVCLVKISNDGDIIWENSITVPKHLSLSAYPNPFNSAVTISFNYGSESAKRLSTIEIFDLNGRRIDFISTERSDEKSPTYPNEISRQARNDSMSEYVWTPGDNIPSGVYLVRAKIGDKDITKRVVYLK